MIGLKNKFAIIISLVLSFIIMLTFASCGIIDSSLGNKKTNTKTNTETNTKTETNTETSTDAETDTDIDTDTDKEEDVLVSQVIFNKASITLEVGDTDEINAFVLPQNATDEFLFWTTSNPNVVTVSEGRITAVKAGTATITAYSSNGITATCTVTVKAPASEIIEVSRIVLNSSSLSLEAEESYTLSATAYPSNATDPSISWESSNEAVAIVTNGRVIALSEGTAIITASSSNGITATCTVTVEAEDFVFEEYGSGYALVGYTGTDTSIVVPSTYKGKNVVAIGSQSGGNGFNRNYDIVSITLPSTIKEINASAFAYCSSLEEINIPSCVSIGDNAFSYCTSLKELTLPNDLIYFGENMFLECIALESLTINSSDIRASFFDYKGIKKLTFGENVTSIEKGALKGFSNLTELTIPFVGGSKDATSASSSTLFGYIFGTESYTGGTSTRQNYGSSSSATYYIPLSLKSVTVTGGNIYYGAFYNCSNITSITIADSITSIGYYAFGGCISLTSVTIGNGVTNIGGRAFYNCTFLTSVTIPDSVTSIDNYAFAECTSLTSITIPNSVTMIGSNAFYKCTSLTSVTFENPYGWRYSLNSNETGTAISSSSLSNKSTAATYLKSTYCNYYWKRS